MFGLLEIISMLIPLIIIGGIVYGIVNWRNREHLPEIDPGIGSVRRVYFYVVLFVTLMMAANGIAQIIRFILDGTLGGPAISTSSTTLAIGGALTIVGLPLWLLHWRLVVKYVRDMPVETRSVARKLYAYLALAVAGALFVFSAVRILQWIFQNGRFSGYDWAAVVVWGAVWLFFWRTETSEGQATPDTLGIRRLYLYVASLATIIMVAIGIGRVVHILLLSGYDALFSDEIVVQGAGGLWTPSMSISVAVALVGGTAWAAHWLYFARGDYGSALRQVYLYVFAILGGVVTSAISLGVILNTIIGWLLGVSPDETAAAQFRILPGAIAGLSAGFGLWAYHWTVVRQEAQASEQEAQGAQRFYAYVLTLLGLIALGVAAAFLASTAIALMSETGRELLIGRDLWRRPVAVSITMVLLGGPVWAYYWNQTQKRVTAFGLQERRALSRRLFIFLVLGAGVLTLLGSVSTVLFIFLRDLLEGSLDLSTVRDVRVALSIAIGVLVFLPYYWRVYLEDRRAEPDEGEPVGARVARKQVSVLVKADGEAFARAIESALGYRVTRLRWADDEASAPPMSGPEFESLVSRVGDAGGSRVLIVPDGSGVRVLSYE